MVKKLFRFLLALTLSLTYLAITPGSVLASFESFEDWTEVDTEGRLTQSAYRCTWTDWEGGDECLLYRNYGVAYFDEDIEIQFAFRVDSLTSGFYGYPFMLADQLGDTSAILAGSADGIGTQLTLYGGTTPRITLKELHGGSEIGTYYYDFSLSTTYYITIVKDDDEGTYGKVYMYIYSDSTRETLLSSGSHSLNSQANYQYAYAPQSYDYPLGVCNGYIENLVMFAGETSIPDVWTFAEQDVSDNALLGGYVESTEEVTSIAFDIGLASGNYTYEYEAEWSVSQSSFQYLTDNWTIGETYYFRAKAENANGWGYGDEQSFTWSGGAYAVISLGNLAVTQGASGNYSATFNVYESPLISTNVTGYLSAAYPPTSGGETLYLITSQGYDSGGASFTFSTGNNTDASGGFILLPETKYYYQGSYEYGEVNYYSSVLSFTTGDANLSEQPSVNITRIRDVSEAYGSNYAIEVTATISTSENSSPVIAQGFEFSANCTSAGALMPTIFRYTASEVAEDGTYTLVFDMSNASWYSGETLYFKAYITTLAYGRIFSGTVSFTPDEPISGGGTTDDDTTSVVTDFAGLIASVRSSLGMTGEMGTWAFMGLILLLIALVFGVAMVAVKDNEVALKAIAVVWVLISISVLGAFVFTGELGIMPILILVGAVVLLIMIVVGILFTRGRAGA